jgi:hypothetical protein
MNSPPQPFSFIWVTAPPNPGVVSTSIIFAFTFICTHFIASYAPAYPLSLTPPSSHWSRPSPLGKTCSTLLFFNYVGKKKKKTKNHEILARLR